MNKTIDVMRWIFAPFYAYVGASWFSFKFFGTPWPEHNEAAAAKALTTAFTNSGIVDPLIYAASLAGGLCLLLRRTTPFGIIILAPLVTGIFLFHVALNRSWMWGTAHLCVLAALAWAFRSAFVPLWSYGKK